MRSILITGANKGIGLAIANALLEEHEDTFVLFGSRDLKRGQQALAGLVKQSPAWASRVELLQIDVSSDESVARAGHEVTTRLEPATLPLGGIVNNAGIGFGSKDMRGVLQVNTYGVHRVCERFIPLLHPEQGRVVNVTSAAGPNFVARCSAEHRRFFLDGTITWRQLDRFMQECLAIEGGDAAFAARGLGQANAYGLSKACANLYTLMLAREHPKLRINACTPGFIETDMTRHHAESSGKSPAEMGMMSPAEGARSTLFLLFDERVGNGHYYGSDAKRSPLDRYRAPGSPPYEGD